MKNLLSLMLAVSLAAPAHAARRRAVTAPPAEELAIVFVSMAGVSLMGDVLDVGAVVRGKVRRTVGVRVERRGGVGKSVAMLRAWVDSPDPRAVIRIDGIPINGAPRLIDAQAPIGAVIVHRIDVEVPVTAAEGAVLSSIRWEASTCND